MKTPPLRFQLAAFLVLSLAVFWGFTLYALEHREREAIEAARAETRGAAHAYAEHTLSTIQRIDQILITLVRTWATHPEEFASEFEAHRQHITDVSIQIGVADRNGWLVFSNLAMPQARVSIADREHFRAHADSADDRLFIGKPVVGRLSGQWSIQFTRPVRRDGKLDGVIIISVRPERFSRFYSPLVLGERSVTSMIRDDGTVMARAPSWQDYIGKVIRGSPFLAADAPLQGNFSRHSVLDGVERVFGYYRLPDYGLTLVSGKAVDEVLAPIGAQRRMTFALAAAVSAALTLMAWLILRGLAARDAAEAALRQTTRELEDYRLNLEKLVEARTSELSQANTELHDTNQQLGEAQGMLLQSEKMASLGQLAAGVAHEINNPIGFVSSNLDSMQEYFADLLKLLDTYAHSEAALGAGQQRVAAIKREIDYDYIRGDLTQVIKESRDGLNRVKRIVHDLKSFSHVGSTDWQLANLHQGLDSTLNIVSNELKYKAEVIREYGELPEVECLPGELNQVFMNLLVNASHAIDGRGQIHIRTGSDSDEVWVAITDTGCGIPPENLRRIFDPFFTTKPVGTGTGLGLSLSYTTIKKHHGRLEVDSTVGQGTTFRICLPKRQPKPTAVQDVMTAQ